MPDIDRMGKENTKQGICGFTSTLYAVYMNQPQLQGQLSGALGAQTRSTRLMAEIKTFLQMMKADGKNNILSQIAELTRTFPGYDAWSVDSYIKEINTLKVGNYSIAMPPEATMEYMRTAWDLHPVLKDNCTSGNVILGLTRTGAPQNKWKNLAHYVNMSRAGRIYSWGEQFDSLADMNTKKRKDYSVIYCITVS